MHCLAACLELCAFSSSAYVFSIAVATMHCTQSKQFYSMPSLAVMELLSVPSTVLSILSVWATIACLPICYYIVSVAYTYAPCLLHMYSVVHSPLC